MSPIFILQVDMINKLVYQGDISIWSKVIYAKSPMIFIVLNMSQITNEWYISKSREKIPLIGDLAHIWYNEI